MKGICFIVFAFTITQIKENVKSNFKWIKDIKGIMEMKMNLKDTTVGFMYQFYMEKIEDNKSRFKIVGNKGNIVVDSEKMKIKFMGKEKVFNLPENMLESLPEKNVEVKLNENTVELVYISETKEFLNRYRVLIDKNTWLITFVEFSTPFKTIYTKIEYQRYEKGYFYKTLKIFSQDGTVFRINYKDLEINKGIPQNVWE
jgi:uncharacterized protein YacL (UPF0231 family)